MSLTELTRFPLLVLSTLTRPPFSQDGDGRISRAEWRKWISEKEAIITKSNLDKDDLVKENRNLRRALNPETRMKFDQFMHAERVAENLRTELEIARDEMNKIQVLSLPLCSLL
jgi:hypothetical protein